MSQHPEERAVYGIALRVDTSTRLGCCREDAPWLFVHLRAYSKSVLT